MMQPYTNRIIISGPAACAVETAYRALVGDRSDASSAPATIGAATVDAARDPIVVTFAAVSRLESDGARFEIPASTCLGDVWPSVSANDRYPVGPATLPRSYVLALDAAYVAHERAQPSSFEPSSSYAYATSLGSGVVIVTTSKGDYNVGFYQNYAAPTLVIGCYKEQHYAVAAATYAANATSAGCPG